MPVPPEELRKRLAANLAEVRGRIAAAAARAGRCPDDVTLVAVTKYADAEAAGLLVDAGCGDLGESRPQELWAKAAALADRPVRWHLIGHLQRNKVERTLPHVALLHALDSVRLMEAVSAAAERAGGTQAALIEVNVSGDAAKHGFRPEEVERLCESLAAARALDVRGLMTMAAAEGGVERARRDFAALRMLRDQLRFAWAGRFALDDLSMGMSGDFEAAVEEGATLVRVGSALFEGLDRP